jgi:4,5-dihydroxyphthalate decarboxylase
MTVQAMSTGTTPVTIALSGTPICAEFLRLAETEQRIVLDPKTVKPIHRAFRPMVMETAFDISELAIVTAIQAIEHGKPIIPLPITVAARLQHKCIVQNASRGTITPADLPGRRVAVRAYSQTTGAWVRTILGMEFGVASDSVTWITQEAPHVAEATEPPNVLRDPNGAGPAELLAGGLVDAAIFGNDLPTDDWVQPLIPDPEVRARASFERSGVVPINHIVAVSRAFAERHPDVVRYVYSTFATARSRALEPARLAMFPFGPDAMRHSVEVLLEHAHAQQLTSRRLSFDTVFGAAANLIGD